MRINGLIVLCFLVQLSGFIGITGQIKKEIETINLFKHIGKNKNKYELIMFL